MIANFESLDGQNYGVTEKTLEQLRFETEQYKDVQIRALGTSVMAQEGSDKARIIGAENGAAVFLWGWYRKTQEAVLITVHVEVLRKPEALRLRRDNQELFRPAKEKDSFEVQTRLSNEMAYLTLLTIGLVRMESERYQDAISLFTRAIQLTTGPEILIDPANVYYFRGNAYFNTRSYENAIEDYTQSLKITPENFCTSCAFHMRGIAYSELSNIDSALSDFLESRKRAPSKPAIHQNIGIAYMKRGI